MKAAGRNPTRQSFVKALESTKLTGGPGLVPFGYSSSNHLGYLGVQIATIAADGTVTTTGPIYTSSDTGPITQYTGSASSPPANGIP
jgi:hypothetical protein